MRRAAGVGGRPILLLLLLVVAVCCSALVPRASPDLAADRAALLALRDAVGPHLRWNASSASPCDGWRGVSCDAGGTRVTGLQLPGSSLAGQLPPRALGNLTALRTLSLRLNALSGGIPDDIAGCAELRALFLQGNRFDGEIPEGFFQLNLLQRLDLSGNLVAGGVSPGFNKLRRLATLYLDNNRLNGTLPADLDLPKLQLFNVSGNGQLTGPVPASLAGMPASAFAGTGLCGAPLLNPCANPPSPTPSPSPQPEPPAPAAPEHGKASKLSAGAIAGIAAGSAAALLALIAAIVFFLCFRRGRRQRRTDVDVSGSPPVPVTVASISTKRSRSRSSRQTAASGNKKLVFVGGAPDTPYDLESLLHASAEILGKGWLGTTYRATLEGGAAVLAVKRLREAPIPEHEFRDRVAAIAALRHDNLATLRAYFYSREEKLLVYDFVDNARSLCSLLHGGGGNNNGSSPARLDFAARARVALAAARGVAFIHASGSGSCSWHGNIKSSNILVPDAARDRAVVTDHGLLQLVAAHVPLKRVTGYRAPEVADPKRASPEADVYAFGVLLLELLTGRPPARSVPGSDEGVDLPEWVRAVVQEEWTAEVFDAAIAVEERVEEEMVRMLRLAVDCTERRPDRRPGMAELAATIEQIVDSAVHKTADNVDDDDFHSISP
ncbi:hypothetical protein PR202_ga15902 [Eleusine coracana subsp. coracana]|uniref:Protein kinase domain-containing protein n=1 Tax=Eleusine coracana subsp. coracana TaxID=191504 RepID=A0AAV5CL27_ELECO|nr:hypothetical protein PR202_ga15902 [Eleusine coracana subsp. coracana]